MQCPGWRWPARHIRSLPVFRRSGNQYLASGAIARQAVAAYPSPMPADAPPPALKIKIQIHCGGEIAMGPGKADLLDAIARTGSISAAGRDLGMSYRRTWLLVDAMNRCWRQPLVSTQPGGAPGSGARMTEFGQRVLGDYRALQAAAGASATGPVWAGLQAMILPEPRDARPG